LRSALFGRDQSKEGDMARIEAERSHALTPHT
jgi:hypothetical protein